MESAVNSESVFAYIIYFVCHFVIAAILILHSFQKWTLSTNSLFILLFIAVCLPLWMVLFNKENNHCTVGNLPTAFKISAG